MNVYVVQNEESLHAVARRFSTTAETLARLNALADPSRTVPGLALAVPGEAHKPRREAVVNAYAYPTLPVRIAAELLGHFSFFSSFCARMTAEGDLIPPDDAALVGAALSCGAMPLLCVANLGEGGGFSGDLAHAVLADSRRQEALLERILALIGARGYRGVSLNLVRLYPFDREACNAFLRRAAQRLHERGRILITALAPKADESRSEWLYAAHDYAVHGEEADWVVLMTYDWGHMHGEPGPVSPLGGIRSVLDYASERIQSGKILMGFSNYAYNWVLPWREGGEASVLSNAAAANLAVSAGAEICYDARAAASHFRYRDAAGLWHEVWFEDARSLRAKMALAEEYALSGVSHWTAEAMGPAALAAQEERFTAVKGLS